MNTELERPHDDPEDAQGFVQILQRTEPAGLSWKYEVLSGASHFTVQPPTLPAGLRAVFSAWEDRSGAGD